MSTSGSTNFNQTRDQISSDTLQLLGVIGAGETASVNDLTFCSNIMNKMIKSWQSQGIHLWKQFEGSITIVADQYLYTLNASNYPDIGRPLDIQNCRYHYVGGLERMMKPLGRSEYDALPTKTTSEGASTAYYYSPGLTSGSLYVWPVPQNTSDTLVITYTKSFDDMDSSSDDFDFPSEWLEALTYNLAVRIAPAYGKVLQKFAPEIIAIAASSLSELQAWDTESGSVRITPNHRYNNS